MDRCARLGPHKASCDPSLRTLSAVSVLPQDHAVPAPVRFRPFPFFLRSRRGVTGGCRGGRARSRPSGSRLQAGGLGWYAPSGLSFPLRFACGPLPLTRPRVAMPSSAPCLSGSHALRVVSMIIAITNSNTVTYETHHGDPSVFPRHCPSTALQGVE